MNKQKRRANVFEWQTFKAELCVDGVEKKKKTKKKKKVDGTEQEDGSRQGEKRDIEKKCTTEQRDSLALSNLLDASCRACK